MADDSARKAQDAIQTTIETLVDFLKVIDDEAKARLMVDAAIKRLRRTSDELGTSG